jgi:ParB-like chromosome segregation protein Spo0J
MAIKLVKLSEIVDNPDNPRSKYDKTKVEDLASSIRENGLIHVPRARQVAENSYELAEGGYRHRAFEFISKAGVDGSESLKQYIVDGELLMPIDITAISDQDLPFIGLEENIRRENLTPMEIANSIERIFARHADITEEMVAKRLNMSQANISNMRRVTRLPKEVLKYIDDETINFTMGRELCSLVDITGLSKGTVEAKMVMIDAIELIGTDGIPNSVSGIKKAIHKAIKAVVADGRLREAKKGNDTSGNSPVFDTSICVKCDKCLKTTDESGKAAYTCTDLTCWNLNQDNAKRKEQERLQEEAAAALKDAEEKEKADAEARAIAEEEVKRNPPPVAPTIPEPRIIRVALSRLTEKGDIYESFSGPQIFNETAAKPPFQDGDEMYISVGDYPDIAVAKRVFRLVPRATYTGEIRRLQTPADTTDDIYRAMLKADPMGAYNGTIAKVDDKEFVLVGPMLVFAPEERKSKPVVAKVEHLNVTPAPPVTEKRKEEPTHGEANTVEAAPKENNPIEPAEAGENGTAGAEVPPAKAVPPADGADQIFTVCLTLSVIVPGASSMSEEEQNIAAEKLFIGLATSGSYHRDDIDITPED